MENLINKLQIKINNLIDDVSLQENKNGQKEQVISIVAKYFNSFRKKIIPEYYKEIVIKKNYQVDYKWFPKDGSHSSGILGSDLVQCCDIMEAKVIIEKRPGREWNNCKKVKITLIKECTNEYNPIIE